MLPFLSAARVPQYPILFRGLAVLPGLAGFSGRDRSRGKRTECGQSVAYLAGVAAREEGRLAGNVIHHNRKTFHHLHQYL